MISQNKDLNLTPPRITRVYDCGFNNISGANHGYLDTFDKRKASEFCFQYDRVAQVKQHFLQIININSEQNMENR